MAFLIVDTFNAVESGFHLCLGRVKHGMLDLKAVLWKGAGRHFKIAGNRVRLQNSLRQNELLAAGCRTCNGFWKHSCMGDVDYLFIQATNLF
jgi:hypothetical protein